MLVVDRTRADGTTLLSLIVGTAWSFDRSGRVENSLATDLGLIKLSLLGGGGLPGVSDAGDCTRGNL